MSAANPARRTDRAPARRGRGPLVPRRPGHDQVVGRDDRRPCRRDRAPRDTGLGSPLHVHRNEDEWFYVTDGELTFWVGGEGDHGAGRLVRLRPPRRSAHVHGHLSPRRASCSSPSPPASRASCARSPSPRDAHPPAARPTSRPPGDDDGHRRRVRDRDPRPARHPLLNRQRSPVTSPPLTQPDRPPPIKGGDQEGTNPHSSWPQASRATWLPQPLPRSASGLEQLRGRFVSTKRRTFRT